MFCSVSDKVSNATLVYGTLSMDVKCQACVGRRERGRKKKEVQSRLMEMDS